MRNGQIETNTLDMRLAARLTGLRQQRGWSLDEMAEQSGVSRASLSRIERGETSPTAAVLGRLCKAFHLPMAVLFAQAEDRGADLVVHDDQTLWTDPQTGFHRRSLSPARPGYRGAMILGELPAGARVSYADTPIPDLEHHLWLQSGTLEVKLAGSAEGAGGDVIHRLSAGDCLRFKLNSANSYHAPGPDPARYLLCVVTP
ncbi:XRE family transcriptional regulator [Roseibium sp.]|uniref:helix-turn-helix domain-containing protein n=2 Tax=Roseibium sp. TaxID=1936156 RepID=UPI003266D268